MDSKAYTEVYNIINCMSDKYKKKIPNRLIEAIRYKMDKTYEFKIDKNNMNNLKLMDDTEKILSIIYTDYISSDEERKIIKNKEKIIYLDDEDKKKEKFESELFKNNFKKHAIGYSSEYLADNLNSKEEDKEETLIITKKEKWYKKLLNFIKKLLKN